MPYNINFKWALGVQNVLFNYLSIIIIIIIILISPPSFLSYRKHQRAAHLPRIRRLPVEPRQRTDPCSSLTTSTNKNPETIDYRAAKIFDIRSWFGFFFSFSIKSGTFHFLFQAVPCGLSYEGSQKAEAQSRRHGNVSATRLLIIGKSRDLFFIFS